MKRKIIFNLLQFHWYGDKTYKTIVQSYKGDHRQLDFVPIKEAFKDNDFRQQLYKIYNDSYDENEDDYDYDDELIEEADFDQLIDQKRENLDRGNYQFTKYKKKLLNQSLIFRCMSCWTNSI